MKKLICAVVVLAIVVSSAQAGTVVHVDDDAGLGGNGLSWNTAFRFLQDALAAASGGGITEIRVAQGVYKPDQDEGGNVTPGDQEATFQLVDGTSLLGGFAGIGAADPDARDIKLNETILSGDRLGDDGPDFANTGENSFRVVSVFATGPPTFVEGFTITGGSKGLLAGEQAHLTVAQCSIAFNHSGGMRCLQVGDISLLDCHFAGNVRDSGAGGGLDIQIAGDVQIDNCSFAGNVAVGGGGLVISLADTLAMTNCTCIDNNGGTGFGGGLLLSGQGPAQVQGCTFSGNNAQNGGGVSNNGSDVVLMNCLVTNNLSTSRGGGLFTGLAGELTGISCQFIGNTSDRGGGVHVNTGSATFMDCVFQDNEATGDGGGVKVEGGFGSAILQQCTFLNNSAVEEGGGVFVDAASFSATDCSLQGNAAGTSGLPRCGGGMAIHGGSFVLAGCEFQTIQRPTAAAASSWSIPIVAGLSSRVRSSATARRGRLREVRAVAALSALVRTQSSSDACSPVMTRVTPQALESVAVLSHPALSVR